MIDPTRAIGILYIGGGLILRGDAESDERTAIVVTGDIEVGGIVRDPDSGRWHFDDELLRWLPATDDSGFATDRDAAKRMREILDFFKGADS